MPDNKLGCNGREPVCIQTRKVYDACRSQDCLEDLRVLLTAESQAVVDRAVSIKPRSASILWTYLDVEPVPFNDGFYSVDAKMFYRITFDAYLGINRPVEIEGLAMFSKRAILFGSEGRARSFSSQMNVSADDLQLLSQTNLPIATIEVLDPVVLSSRCADPCECFNGSDNCLCCDVPEAVAAAFRSSLVPGENCRRLFVTLGQFSLLRLERNTQLMISGAEYCVPDKECTPCAEGDPCDAFSRFCFPTSEFFPPDNRQNRGGCCR